MQWRIVIVTSTVKVHFDFLGQHMSYVSQIISAPESFHQTINLSINNSRSFILVSANQSNDFSVRPTNLYHVADLLDHEFVAFLLFLLILFESQIFQTHAFLFLFDWWKGRQNTSIVLNDTLTNL